MTEYTLMVGDCVDRLKELPDASIDAVVTDPPYGLSKQPDMAEVMRHWLNGDDYKHTGAGFMGKSWDSFVPGPSVWRECFRVLKPGGHLLAFFGSRTYDIGALAIRLAGFEVRDQIMWVYGSGFPKSLDVTKAIDKRGGAVAGFSEFRDAVKHAMKKNGVSRSVLQDALGNYMLGHYITAGSQPAVPNLRDYQIIRDTVNLGNQFDYLFLPEAEREVVGFQKRGQSVNTGFMSEGNNITLPASKAAKQWQGWGTALKPAHEPIVMARKPISTTVAANVLEHGTGAINVDGCRVGTEGGETHKGGYQDAMVGGRVAGDGVETNLTPKGRWPANFIHDGSDEAVALLGEPARYFYCAKASKKDRDEGVAGVAGVGALRDNGRQSLPRKNHHPTVKPTDLMRYLVRMVTPPSGTVLDPFTGSGSTGKACMIEGFNFVGCELSDEYAEIAKARIEYAKTLKPEPKPQKDMFSD